ncbi:MAG: cyclomaltodextrinase C-terminal domain-containing protein, partial [Bacteroidota bacterium]
TFNTARFAESIKNHKSGTDVITGKTVDVSSSITLEAKSVLVLELK